jgi:hypothetical protein
MPNRRRKQHVVPSAMLGFHHSVTPVGIATDISETMGSTHHRPLSGLLFPMSLRDENDTLSASPMSWASPPPETPISQASPSHRSFDEWVREKTEECKLEAVERAKRVVDEVPEVCRGGLLAASFGAASSELTDLNGFGPTVVRGAGLLSLCDTTQGVESKVGRGVNLINLDTDPIAVRGQNMSMAIDSPCVRGSRMIPTQHETITVSSQTTFTRAAMLSQITTTVTIGSRRGSNLEEMNDIKVATEKRKPHVATRGSKLAGKPRKSRW